MKHASTTAKIGLAVLRENCVNVSSQEIVVFLGPYFLEDLFSQVLTEEKQKFGAYRKMLYTKEYEPN
jgi:hypothetical protein